VIPSATTRLLVLLGDPVAHSLSPAFQNAAIRHAGLDAVYLALRCGTESVAPLIRALCRAGGGGNVTVPHKADAARCIERPTPDVLRTGACNTFWADESGAICGDNTDVEGFRHAALELTGTSLSGIRCLMIGAGGAAAAALCALLQDGAAAVTLLNRSADRASALAARLDPGGDLVRVIADAGQLQGEPYDLVVNASSVGLHEDEPLPLDLEPLGDVGAALDLVYRRRSGTPWVRHAITLGIPAADGSTMLMAQGAAAFHRWFGVEPPLHVMREAMLHQR
jgi:shikimate dehydrogenase